MTENLAKRNLMPKCPENNKQAWDSFEQQMQMRRELAHRSVSRPLPPSLPPSFSDPSPFPVPHTHPHSTRATHAHTHTHTFGIVSCMVKSISLKTTFTVGTRNKDHKVSSVPCLCFSVCATVFAPCLCASCVHVQGNAGHGRRRWGCKSPAQ